MPYPTRHLGDDVTDLVDYTDDGSTPIDQFANSFTPATSTLPTPSTSGSGLLSTILTDVTQFIKPGTPSTIPLYTPTSTAIGSTLQSPVVLAGVALVAYLLLSRRH